MEKDGPLNIYTASRCLIPTLTGQETLFKEALNWLQFSFTSDRAGSYVAPASTVLSQSPIAEEGELFLTILQHLRRLYLEVYGPAVSLGRVHACRYFHLGEDGEVLSSRNLHIIRFSELGAYTGKF